MKLKYVIASVFLHLAFLWIGRREFLRQLDQVQPSQTKAPKYVEVLAIDKSRAMGETPEKPESSRGAPSVHHFPLSQLGLFSHGFRLRAKGGYSGESEKSSTGTSDAYEVSRAMIEERASLLYPGLKFIHGKVDDLLTYPHELAMRGHAGKVYAQLDVSDRGQMLGEFQSVHAENRYLKVVALRALRKALLEPLPESLVLPEKILRLGAVLLFDLKTRTVTLADLKIEKVLKNILTFHRQSAANSNYRDDPDW